MKMICPHCGVKGSANDALLGRKVKCPKCTTVFVVAAEVVEAIEVDELELEPIEESSALEDDITTEEEVDQVISSLLVGGSGHVGEELATEAPASSEETTDNVPAKDELVAALSDNDENVGEHDEWQGEEDDTLTVIEDFPEEAFNDSDKLEEEAEPTLDDLGDEPSDEKEIRLDEAEVPGAEEDEPQIDDGPTSEAIEESLDFEDGFFDDEVIVGEDNEEGKADDDGLPEELFGDEEQDDLLESDDSGAAEVDEVADILEGEQQEDRESNVSAPPPENEVMLEASFLDEDLDSKLAAEEEENDIDLEAGAVAMIQKCSACDRYVDPEAKYEHNGNVYCSKCIPADLVGEDGDVQQIDDVPLADEVPEVEEADNAEDTSEDNAAVQTVADSEEVYTPGRFTIITLIKDSWSYSKGVKGALWGAILVMYILLIGLGVAATLLSMQFLQEVDRMAAMLIDGGLQALLSFLSYVFTAGIIMIAVNRIGQRPYSWKMVFSGFKRFGSMLGLVILQTIMLIIGFLLFVLPGIYLSVGYILAIPLVFIKGLSPWQALETSRKAIHTRWWTVFFALIAMSILVSLSAIPLGIGLIWTVPMFVVMIGVLYYLFFGADEEYEEFD